MPTAPEPRAFGRLPSGEAVEAYTLASGSGASAEVITYGGIVMALRVPDGRGSLADVVLGFASLAPYAAGHPCFGAIIGRVAGRLTGGRFTLDGRAYRLACNDGPNHLHGGLVGFDRRLWTACPIARADGAVGLRLSYRSPDGEEGYPRTVDVVVTYTLTPNNDFIVETEAATDRPTPLCLTHHSYFNLAGEGTDDVSGHWLQVFADEYVPTDANLTLQNRRVAVDETNDFNRPRRVGAALPHLFQRHGAFYYVRRPVHSPGAAVHAARVTEPTTRIGLDVRTTEDCLQLYTGSGLDGAHVGKSGRPYRPHAGLCLECQGYPNAISVPALGDIVLRPGVVRRQSTVYSFFTF